MSCCCPISPFGKNVILSVCAQARKAEPAADGKVLVSAPGGGGGGGLEGLEIRASE